MQVKVDYSPKAKELGNDNSIPGCYAIYHRKNIFCKWKQLKQTYADLYLAKLDAIKYKENHLPIYIKKH